MKHARLPLLLLAGGLLASGCGGSDEPRFGPLSTASPTVSTVPSIQIGTIPLVHTSEQQAVAQAQAAAAESRTPAGRKRVRDRVKRLRPQRGAVAGQFCSPFGARGVTAAGQVLTCTYTAADPILRWRGPGQAGTPTATPSPTGGTTTTAPATPSPPTATTAPPTTGPSPTRPVSGSPTPTEPTPGEPTPTEPTPSEPTPTQSSPTLPVTSDSPTSPPPS